MVLDLADGLRFSFTVITFADSNDMDKMNTDKSCHGQLTLRSC